MTQVWTANANVAALNMELLRGPRRLSVKDRVSDTKSDADRNALRAEDATETDAVDILAPAISVAIDFFDASHHSRQHASVREAEAAYRSSED